MLFRSSLVVLAAGLVGVWAQDTFRINTPTSVVQCLPIQLTWTGGQRPYFISVIKGGQAGSKALKEFPQTDGTSTTWNVDLPANQPFTLQARDQTGALAYSDQFTIQPGTTKCTLASASDSTNSSSSAPSSSSNSSSSPSSTGTASNTTSSTGAASTTSTSVNSASVNSTKASTTAQSSSAVRISSGLYAATLSLALAVFA